MDSNNKFLNLLMSRIEELHQTPKVQVERAFSPILSLFIAEVLTAAYWDHPALHGNYELVCMEFPLKKPENAQSTNIDFLLINSTTSALVFLEIKTDIHSFDRSQLENYLRLKEEVKEYGGGFLLQNLSVITTQSGRSEKYFFLQKLIEPFKKTMIGAFDLKVIYLVPKSAKPRLQAENGIDGVVSFADLPVEIESELANEWRVIRDSLVKLESVESAPHFSGFQVDPKSFSEKVTPIVTRGSIKNETMEERIRRQIEAYCLETMPAGVVPKLVYLGNTGEGGSPNYQVLFSNHKIVPFFNSGKLFTRATAFKISNLKKPVPWEKFGV